MSNPIAVTILAVSLGLVAGWTSPYLAKLTNKETKIHITDTEASWVASFLPMGRLLGAICGSLTTEYFGSKISLVLTGFPLMIGWICIICATSATWFYIFRIFTGKWLFSSSSSSYSVFLFFFFLSRNEVHSRAVRIDKSHFLRHRNRYVDGDVLHLFSNFHRWNINSTYTRCLNRASD